MEFATSAEFARHIRSAVEGYLKPGARVTFRGSFAGDQHDEYSDVDLHAGVFGRELDAAFFSDLESFLTDLYGPALVRYDPDNADTTDYQHVRFSFYGLPISGA